MWKTVLARFGLVVVSLATTAIFLELMLQVGSTLVDAPLEAGSASWKTEARRVLALGDSNTYGVWLSAREKDAYPPQLETIWNSGRPEPIEVLNLGYPGTNSSRMLGLYAEFNEVFAPDIVLVMVGVNDFWTQPLAFRDEEVKSGFVAFVKRHSRLYRGLYILLRRSGADAVEVVDAPDSTFMRGKGAIRVGGREFELGWTTEIGDPDTVEAELRNNLRQLVVLSREYSARLVLMTYPGHFRYYSLANPAIREVANENEIPLIDLAREFTVLCPNLSCPEWLFEDQHPNVAGYRLVAETIASRLRVLLD